MRVTRLRLQRFRGFETLTLTPTTHVLVVGEPRAGRSDLIAALSRVLDHRSTRREADPLDVHRPSGATPVPAALVTTSPDEAGNQSKLTGADVTRSTSSGEVPHDAAHQPETNSPTRLLTEVEVTLVDLDPATKQHFGSYLEGIDLATGQVIEPGDDGLPGDAERGLRLCYRLDYDEIVGETSHWVDYPAVSHPETRDFTKVRADDRRRLPFVHLERTRPLQLRAESLFRSILNELDPQGTADALNILGSEVQHATTTLAKSPAVSAGLEHVLCPDIAGLLGLTSDRDLVEAVEHRSTADPESVEGAAKTPSPADNIAFFAEDGTVNALLRGLQPALQLDQAGLLPLSSHGSTTAAVLATAEALVAATVPGAIVLADDFGDALDTGVGEYLAGLLRAQVGQLWLTTRRPEVARAFPPEQMIRLTRHTGARRTHVLPEARDRKELAARRHLHPQLLSALSATAIILVEGPHDLAGYGAVEQRRLVQDGTRTTAAAGARLVAAGFGEEGGTTAIAPLARLARSLGFRIIALIDHDKPGPGADRERDQLLADCDVVVRLPPRVSVERALLYGLTIKAVRIAAQSVFDAFGVSVDLSAVDDAPVGRKVVDHLKDKSGLHAPFVAALADDVPTPPLAAAALDAVIAAANPQYASKTIDISLPDAAAT